MDDEDMKRALQWYGVDFHARQGNNKPLIAYLRKHQMHDEVPEYGPDYSLIADVLEGNLTPDRGRPRRGKIARGLRIFLVGEMVEAARSKGKGMSLERAYTEVSGKTSLSESSVKAEYTKWKKTRDTKEDNGV